MSEASATRRSARALAVVAHRGFNLSLLISGALLLGVLALGWKPQWLDWAELVLGLTMAAEGVLLAANWRGARGLTLERLQRRRTRRQARASLRSRLVWRLASPALQLLGVAWIGAGMLTAALGLGRIV